MRLGRDPSSGTEKPARRGAKRVAEILKLHWRTAPHDARLNQPVETTGPKIKPLPAAIREGENEFVASKIAAGWPVDRVRVGKVADRPEPKQCAAIVSSRKQAINLFFKRSTRTRSHCAMISMVARRSVRRSG